MATWSHHPPQQPLLHLSPFFPCKGSSANPGCWWGTVLVRTHIRGCLSICWEKLSCLSALEREEDQNVPEVLSLGFSGRGSQEGSLMTAYFFPTWSLAHSAGCLPHLRSAPFPGRVLKTHLPSPRWSGRNPHIHSTQWLIKNESILWQVLFVRQQGGRGGEKCTVDEAKGLWPEGRIGKQSGVSSDLLLPSTEAGL